MSLKCGLCKYAALKSFKLMLSLVSLNTFLLIWFISLSISPCFGKNLCVILLGSTISCNGGGNSKSLWSGILICGSKTSSLSPTSTPSMGVGLSAFLYFLLRVSILFSLSSSHSGIEESTLFGVICVIGLVGGSNLDTSLVMTWGVSENVSSGPCSGSVS